MVLECGATEDILSSLPSPYRVVLDKRGNFGSQIGISDKKNGALKRKYCVDSYNFAYAIRRCEMGLVRGETIMAEQQLADARKYLLDLELINEGDDPHFMRYNKLSKDFLDRLWETYPKSLEKEDVKSARQIIVELYKEVMEKSENGVFDETLYYLFDYETVF